MFKKKRDQMMGKRTTGNLTEMMPKQCHENEEHGSYHDMAVTSTSFQEEVECLSKEPVPKKIRNPKDDAREKFLQLEREKIAILKNKQANDVDDGRMFLLSFLPSMNKLSPKKQSLFRMKVQQTLHEFLYDGE